MEFRDKNWETLYLEDIQQIMESVMDRQYLKFQQTMSFFNMEPKGEKKAHGDVLRRVEEAVRYGGLGLRKSFPQL